MKRALRAVGLCAVAVLAGSCSNASPAAPGASAVTLLASPFTLTCGQWYPTVPPVTRTVADLTFTGDNTVSAAVLDALRASGGNVIYTFLAGQRVRVEIDVARIMSLRAEPTRLWYAATVSNLSSQALSFIVSLDQAPTQEDLAAAQALGGAIVFQSVSSKYYVVHIEDARLPQLRTLPHVRSVEPDGIVCAG